MTTTEGSVATERSVDNEGSVDYEVVDADGHIELPDGWWQPYLPAKYREWAPSLQGRGAEGREFTRHWPDPPAPTRNHPGGADPHARLAAMDLDGVDVAYLYPSQVLSVMPTLKSSAFALALAQAYNEWLLDYCSVDPHRLRPVALVPQQDLVLAVEEMERVAARGVRAVMLRPNPVLDVNIDHPNYERVWAAAQAAELTIGIHEGAGGLPRGAQAGVDRCHTFSQVHVVCHPFEHMLACLLLLTGGVLERHPRLRVGFMESGAGWAPFWLNRMDEHWEQPHSGRPTPEPPSFYFVRQCFLGVEPADHLLPQMLEFGLGDSLVYSSDFPHFDAVWPGSAAALLDRTDVADAAKRKVAHDNALRMYGVTQAV